MKISADFTVIPDAFAKAAPPENCIDGTPIVSFPFYIDELDPSEVWVTHGREEAIVRWCSLAGRPARPLHLVGYEDEAED